MLEVLNKQLKKHGIRFSVCGGYAVVLHGLPRTTIDLDIVVELSEKNLTKLEAALSELGFVSQIPVNAKQIFDFRNEYIKNRNLIAWSFYNKANSIEVLDVLITHSLEEFETVQKKIRDFSVSILSIDSLIRLKQEANRPQDIADIEALQQLKQLTKKEKK